LQSESFFATKAISQVKPNQRAKKQEEEIRKREEEGGREGEREKK